MAGVRLDRAVERSGPVVGDEGERGPPLALRRVESRVRRDRDETRVRLRVVADVACDHRQPVEPGRTLARDRGDGRVAELGDLRRGVGRGPGGQRPRLRHRREQLPALVERDRVRADLADPVERHASPGPTRQCRIGRIVSAAIESAEP